MASQSHVAGLYGWLSCCFSILHFRATSAHHNSYTAHMGLSAMPEEFLGQQRWCSAALQTVSGLNKFSSSKLPYAYSHVTASVRVSLLQSLSPWKALKVIFLPLNTCLSNQTPHIHLQVIYRGVARKRKLWWQRDEWNCWRKI